MNILIIGDSHAEGYLPHSRIRSNAIAEELGTPAEMRLAVSGSTALHWAADRDGWLTRALERAGRCDAALVSLLGNDLFEAASDGRVDTAEVAASTAALFSVVSRVAATAPRTFVLLYGYPFFDNSARKMIALGLLDAAIASVCLVAGEVTGARIETIDERKILSRSDWPGDDIHPFESGYRKIGAEIRRRMTEEQTR